MSCKELLTFNLIGPFRLLSTWEESMGGTYEMLLVNAGGPSIH
jgi:hypothetical protein